MTTDQDLIFMQSNKQKRIKYLVVLHVIFELNFPWSIIHCKEVEIPEVANHQQQTHPMSSHLQWKMHVLLECLTQSQTVKKSTEKSAKNF